MGPTTEHAPGKRALPVDRNGGTDAGATAMVARFSIMTYAGILLAPAVIGWVAELIGLTWTLATVIPLLLAVALGARNAQQRDRQPVATVGVSRQRWCGWPSGS